MAETMTSLEQPDDEITDDQLGMMLLSLADKICVAKRRENECENFTTSVSVPDRNLGYVDQCWSLPIRKAFKHRLGLDDLTRWLDALGETE